MAEQRSIVLGAIVTALIVAGASFFLFVGDSAQPTSLTSTARTTPAAVTPSPSDDAAMAEENSDEVNDTVTPTSDDTVVTQLPSSDTVPEATSEEPTIAGAEDVAVTAETGPAETTALGALAATLFGFWGLRRLLTVSA